MYNVGGVVKIVFIFFSIFFAVPRHTRSFASQKRGQGRPAKRAFIRTANFRAMATLATPLWPRRSFNR